VGGGGWSWNVDGMCAGTGTHLPRSTSWGQMTRSVHLPLSSAANIHGHDGWQGWVGGIVAPRRQAVAGVAEKHVGWRLSAVKRVRRNQSPRRPIPGAHRHERNGDGGTGLQEDGQQLVTWVRWRKAPRAGALQHHTSGCREVRHQHHVARRCSRDAHHLLGPTSAGDSEDGAICGELQPHDGHARKIVPPRHVASGEGNVVHLPEGAWEGGIVFQRQHRMRVTLPLCAATRGVPSQSVEEAWSVFAQVAVHQPLASKPIPFRYRRKQKRTASRCVSPAGAEEGGPCRATVGVAAV